MATEPVGARAGPMLPLALHPHTGDSPTQKGVRCARQLQWLQRGQEQVWLHLTLPQCVTPAYWERIFLKSPV